MVFRIAAARTVLVLPILSILLPLKLAQIVMLFLLLFVTFLKLITLLLSESSISFVRIRLMLRMIPLLSFVKSFFMLVVRILRMSRPLVSLLDKPQKSMLCMIA
jgi:hypothetical protein